MMHSKKILYFTLSLACFLLAFLLSMIALRGRDEALAAHLRAEGHKNLTVVHRDYQRA